MRSRRKLRGCVIAASAGGYSALCTLFAGLSARFNPCVIAVLHSASDNHEALAASFARVCALPVTQACARERIRPRHVYIAPPGYHLLVEKNERFSLSMDEKVCYVRPSADVLFEAAVDAWGAAMIGVVLTGANEDGARGLQQVRARGGRAIVQSPVDAEVPQMPEAALRIAGADHVLRLEEIAPLLNRLAGAAA